MEKTWRVLVITILAVIAIAAAIWSARAISSRVFVVEDQAKPVVATTIYPVYSLVKAIVGDEAEVTLLVPPGANSHTFEPQPATINNLTRASMVFAIGQGLDDWVGREAQQVGQEQVVWLDQNVNLIPDNPHYWLSPVEAESMIATITDALVERYPDRQAVWQSHSLLLNEQIDSLVSDYQDKFDQQNINIATFHNAFSYLARDFNFTVVTTFEEIPGEEPTPGWLADFQQQVQQYQLSVVFAEPQSSEQSLQTIADDLGVKIETLDPIGGQSGRVTYTDLIKYNLDTILNSNE